MDDRQNAEFIEKVRQLYVDHFDPTEVLEDGDTPFSIGTGVVLFSVNYIDGQTSWIMVRDGSWIEAVGLTTVASVELSP